MSGNPLPIDSHNNDLALNYQGKPLLSSQLVVIAIAMGLDFVHFFLNSFL